MNQFFVDLAASVYRLIWVMPFAAFCVPLIVHERRLERMREQGVPEELIFKASYKRAFVSGIIALAVVGFIVLWIDANAHAILRSAHWDD